jgi:hypothetical protein
MYMCRTNYTDYRIKTFICIDKLYELSEQTVYVSNKFYKLLKQKNCMYWILYELTEQIIEEKQIFTKGEINIEK